MKHILPLSLAPISSSWSTKFNDQRSFPKYLQTIMEEFDFNSLTEALGQMKLADTTDDMLEEINEDLTKEEESKLPKIILFCFAYAHSQWECLEN